MQVGYGSGSTVGEIGNGHILTVHGTWARLNANANPVGPWYPGDIINDRVFTGAAWISLPAGWRPDPVRRHEFRWWNGHSWSEHVMSKGVRFSEAATMPVQQVHRTQQLPAGHKRTGFWDAANTVATVVNRLAFSGWVLFWLAVAGWSAWIAYDTNELRFLWLTGTASANIFSYKLVGTSWRQFKKRLAKLPYVICGVVAAGGVWLSLRFDDPDVLKVTMIVVPIGLIVSWVIS